MKKLLLTSTAAVVWWASTAGAVSADPITAALAAVLGGGAVAVAVAQVVVGLGLNLLAAAASKALAGKRRQQIDVNFEAQVGDDVPLSFVVGDYVTAGTRKFVGSWGPNTKYIVEVFEVSCLPQPGTPELWINDEPATVLWGETGTHTDQVVTGYTTVERVRRGETYDEIVPVYATATLVLGSPLTNGANNGAARCWIKWLDGSQTVADPYLVGAFGDHPDHPWDTTAVGVGKTYAIMTTQYDADTMSQAPTFLFKPAPLPCYDPRKDSTVGGVGTHRWGNVATYQPSCNNGVVAYNLARGIYYGSEWVFGGQNMSAWRLPLLDWVAAMNACDTLVTLASGATEPRFRCGAEVHADMEPLDVIEQIGLAANMRFAEVGGRLKPLVDLPGAAVYTFTDDAIVVTAGQDLQPFAPMSQTYNSVTAVYPEPAQLWKPKDSPEIKLANGLARDGQYLPLAITFPAAPFEFQVQRLAYAHLMDAQRVVVHEITLPPGAYALEPLDLVTWTSARNGYNAKQFLVMAVSKLPGMNVQIVIREVDPADYSWSPALQQTSNVVPVVPRPVVRHPVTSFAATAVLLDDDDGQPRQAGIQVTCSGGLSGVSGLRIQVRRPASEEATVDIELPFTPPFIWVVAGVAPKTDYLVSVLPISPFATGSWSADIPVTTEDVLVPLTGLTPGLADIIEGTALLAEEAALAAAAVRADHDALVGDFIGDLATAFAETNSRASAGFNGWLKDPIFTEWEPGNISSANWDVRSNIGNYGAEGGGAYGRGLTLNIPSGATSTALIASSNAKGFVGADPTIDHVVFDLELEYIAGNPNSSTIRVDWSTDGVTWVPGSFVTPAGTFGEGLFDRIALAPKPGVRQAVSVLWKRPTGYSNHIRWRFFPKSGAASGVVQMVVHRANLRAATKADIDAGKDFSIATATPGQLTTVVGAGAAISGLNSAFTARTGGLEGSVTNILGARADLLTGTALASLLTQLQVSTVTGLSAWATAQATAVTSLQGNASASYAFRVGAGGASAGLELVAFNNAQTGAASALKLSGQHIDLMASSVRISDPGNIFPDFDMEDARFYSTATASAYAFAAVADNRLGRRFVLIPASAYAEDVASGWFAVEPSTEYLATATAWVLSSSGTVVVSVEFGAMDTVGIVTPISAALVINSTSAIIAQASTVITTPANARRARYRVDRAAGGTGQARAGGFKLQKRAGASLLVDGIFAVTGMAAFGGQLSSTVYTPGVAGWTIKADGSAEFNDLEVRADMIVDGAVARQVVSVGPGYEVTLTGSGIPLTPQIPFSAFPYLYDGSNPYYASIAVNPLLFTISGTWVLKHVGKSQVTMQVETSVDGGSTWTYGVVKGFYFDGGAVGDKRSFAVRILDTMGNLTIGTGVLYRVTGSTFVVAATPATSLGLLDAVVTVEQVNK